MYIHNFVIHSSIQGYLGCFHVLAIANNVVMNMDVKIFSSYSFVSFGHVPRDGIAGSYGSAIFNF